MGALHIVSYSGLFGAGQRDAFWKQNLAGYIPAKCSPTVTLCNYLRCLLKANS